jgi:ABC-2 type transport system permease protein
LGKFLAALTLFAIMLVPTAVYLVFMYAHSDPRPPWSLILVGYLGVLLLGSSLLALGSFLSSLTESQIVASVLTFGAFLMLWVIDAGARGGDSVGGKILQYLSVIHHYDDFTRGIIDTSSVVYYLSFFVFFIFLTVRSIDSIRWRRA